MVSLPSIAISFTQYSFLVVSVRYAYTYVALYGQTYCEAAQSTFQLLESRGFDAVLNGTFIARQCVNTGLLISVHVCRLIVEYTDDLTGPVLGLGILIGGLATGAATYGLAMTSATVTTTEAALQWALLGFVVRCVTRAH